MQLLRYMAYIWEDYEKEQENYQQGQDRGSDRGDKEQTYGTII